MNKERKIFRVDIGSMSLEKAKKIIEQFRDDLQSNKE